MDWNQVVNDLTVAMAPLVIGLVVTLASIGIKRLNAYLKAKTENETLRGAFDQISEVAWSAVNELEQGARKAMSDGKLSKEEGAELKQMALDRIRAQAPKAVAGLAEAGMEKLEEFLSGKIEAYVSGLKKGA